MVVLYLLHYFLAIFRPTYRRSSSGNKKTLKIKTLIQIT